MTLKFKCKGKDCKEEIVYDYAEDIVFHLTLTTEKDMEIPNYIKYIHLTCKNNHTFSYMISEAEKSP